MAIFNSLGSNYSSGFVSKSLLTLGSRSATEKLRSDLAKQFDGEVTLTYKGRQALELALRHSGLKAGSEVGINGFTCYVVYQAVVRAGYKPVFLDVAPGGLDFDLDQVKKHKYLAAIIVQNTLGLPVDMPALAKYCRENKLLLIEDLAHSLGAVYEDGRTAGSVGDLVMLSFSQDKPADVVAGGALVDRSKKNLPAVSLPPVSAWQRLKNRAYPLWTALIRGLYPIGLGRYLHFALKKLHWLATPMSDNLSGINRMSNATAALLLGALDQFPDDLTHRRQIAAIYQKNLNTDLQYKTRGQPSFLRFPINIANRPGLVAVLKKQGIYIGDTWYDAPIAPKRYLNQTDYKTGQCPEAEKVAVEIVNLPTHRHVTEEVAQALCATINQWSQPKK